MHCEAEHAQWDAGMRKIFDYRDLGIKQGTDGNFVAQVIRANGETEQDHIHHWHVHDCAFQMIYILKGWAVFEYEGIGVRRLNAGDCVNQPPMIRHREIECSPDLELVEIVSPADFTTSLADAPG